MFVFAVACTVLDVALAELLVRHVLRKNTRHDTLLLSKGAASLFA